VRSSADEGKVGSGSGPVSVTVSTDNRDLVAVSSPNEVLVGGHLDKSTVRVWSGEELW